MLAHCLTGIMQSNVNIIHHRTKQNEGRAAANEERKKSDENKQLRVASGGLDVG